MDYWEPCSPRSSRGVSHNVRGTDQRLEMSTMFLCILDAFTFVQMTLELIEVALLQTNLEIDNMICLRWTGE